MRVVMNFVIKTDAVEDRGSKLVRRRLLLLVRDDRVEGTQH